MYMGLRSTIKSVRTQNVDPHICRGVREGRPGDLWIQFLVVLILSQGHGS